MTSKEWKKQNLEKVKLYRKKYKQRHPEIIKASKRRNYLRHLVERKKYEQEYRKTHPWVYQNRWMKLRFIILQRDKFTCQYCGRKAPEVRLWVDHIKPQSKFPELKYQEKNLITACSDCNRGKADMLLII